jgi:hypothetical protein
MRVSLNNLPAFPALVFCLIAEIASAYPTCLIRISNNLQLLTFLERVVGTSVRRRHT